MDYCEVVYMECCCLKTVVLLGGSTNCVLLFKQFCYWEVAQIVYCCLNSFGNCFAVVKTVFIDNDGEATER